MFHKEYLSLGNKARRKIIMDNKIKHLELVQGVINRMASNSFMLKGWAVTLISGIFVLAGKDTDKLYFLVAYLPVIVFWGLDSYYLFQERLYRSLYDKICKSNEDKIDFSLNASKEEFKNDKNCLSNCILSATELWFYLPLLFVCTGIIIITYL